MNPVEGFVFCFLPSFKVPDPAEEGWREGGWHRPRERSARRPEGIRDCGRSVHSALLSLFLSTTDTDTPVAKTYAATEDTSICLKTTAIIKPPR